MYAQIAQMGIGAIQAATNKRPDQPDYEIPDAILKAGNYLQNRQFSGLAGKDIMESNIEGKAASSITDLRDLVSPSAVLAGVTNIHANTLHQQRQIELADAQVKEQNKDKYANFLTNTLAPSSRS